jgi:hypothetical protein
LEELFLVAIPAHGQFSLSIVYTKAVVLLEDDNALVA